MASESTIPIIIPENIWIGPIDPIDDNYINIGESILNTFKSKPDFIGQVDAKTGEKNTFQQMRERSVKCALWLKKFGVRRNDIVTVCTSNHLDTYIPYLATLYIGAILSVWHEYRTINLRYYIQSGPKVIFTDIDKAPVILKVAKLMKVSTKIIVFKKKSKKEKQFESLKSILNSDFDEDEIDEFSCTKLESNRDTAVILFSSSTIGYIRKHVAIPHAFFTSPSNQQMPVMSSNDVGLWVESLHWNISLILTIRCILSYVKAIKINEFSNPSLEECFCNIIQKYKVNWVFLKMGMVEQFSNLEVFERYNMSSLKQMIYSCRNTSFTCFSSLVTVLPNAVVTRVYCLPETGMIAFHLNTGDRLFSYLSTNVALLFADFNTTFPLPPFKYGFIWCTSPSLTNGYFNSTTGDIIDVTENGWFHTDEIGYGNENGGIRIVERGKEGNIISYRNYHFSPLEIETMLQEHPEIEQAVIVPIYNLSDGHHPMALVIRKEGSKITEEDIIKLVAEYVDDDRKQLRAGVLFMKSLANFHSGHYNRRRICKFAREYVFNTKGI